MNISALLVAASFLPSEVCVLDMKVTMDDPVAICAVSFAAKQLSEPASSFRLLMISRCNSGDYVYLGRANNPTDMLHPWIVFKSNDGNLLSRNDE
jgi:hypothetical protein